MTSSSSANGDHADNEDIPEDAGDAAPGSGTDAAGPFLNIPDSFDPNATPIDPPLDICRLYIVHIDNRDGGLPVCPMNIMSGGGPTSCDPDAVCVIPGRCGGGCQCFEKQWCCQVLAC